MNLIQTYFAAAIIFYVAAILTAPIDLRKRSDWAELLVATLLWPLVILAIVMKGAMRLFERAKESFVTK